MRLNQNVIVAGGSVSGLLAALSAAKHGFGVTIVERFGSEATRRTIFNLPPTATDALKWFDDGGDALIDPLQVIRVRLVDRVTSGGPINRLEGSERARDRVLADAARPLGWDPLIRGSQGFLDSRPWARIEIGALENHLRTYIAERFPQVQFRWNTTVTGIDQRVDGVTAHVMGPSGQADAIQGAFLVSATGGRNVLGIERNLSPETAHFVGGLLEPVAPDNVQLRRVFRDGSTWDASTHGLNPPGQAWGSVELTGTGRPELPNSLIWAQINKDANTVDDPELLRRVVLERARMLDLGHLKLIDDDPLLKVNVQIGVLRDNSAVLGRVLLAGDELLGTYFPTSTGAAHAIGANGPLVDRAMHDLAQPGANIEAVLRAYDVAARRAAWEMFVLGRNELRQDLGLPTLSRGLEDVGLLPAGRGIGTAAP